MRGLKLILVSNMLDILGYNMTRFYLPLKVCGQACGHDWALCKAAPGGMVSKGRKKS